jgi:7 transmembrane receptor (rhodopsin family)
VCAADQREVVRISRKKAHLLRAGCNFWTCDALQVRCPWVCELTNHPGYVLYSAIGSFYLPMLVMLFFYWRIYRAAVQTTRAINQVKKQFLNFSLKVLTFKDCFWLV